jgi:hypothetical protein
MKRFTFGLCCIFYCVGFCLPQTSAPNKYDQDVVVNSGLGRSHVDDGAFDLLLPSELTVEDPNGPMHSYRAIPAFNPPHTAAEVGRDPCSHTLLLVGEGGGAGSEEAARGPNEKKIVAIPPSGGIAIVEVDDRCIKQLTDENVLARLAGEAQQIDGLIPTSRMISYKVGDRPVFLAMSNGFSKDEKGERNPKAGMTLVGNISLKANGHFFVVGMVCNDVELFNRMLKLRVQFATGPSERLVPFELHNGGDIKDPVPK